MLTHGLHRYIGQSAGRVDGGAGRICQPSNRGLGTNRSGLTNSLPGASGAMVASICMACGSSTGIQDSEAFLSF